VVCERKELVAALRNVLAVVNQRIGQPILHTVKLTAGASHQFTLAASDLDVGIRRAVRGVAVVQPGTACVSASRLKLIIDQLEARSLLTAVRQGAVVLDEANEGIQLHFDVGSLRLVSQGEDGATCRAELAIVHEGQPVSMTLHPRYLIEPLRMLRRQTRVTVEWADANSPLVLRAQDGFVNLIMPITTAA
jgi:DNA polymerase-3 subunit beta